MSSTTTRKASAAKRSSQVVEHPSFVEMISEAIIENADRTGISRAALKKYLETRWKIEFNAANNSQLNRSIKSGASKGTFTLPKGPSGKVKLAPESGSSKENKPINRTKPTKPKTTTKSTLTKSSAAKSKTGKKPPVADKKVKGKTPAKSAGKSTSKTPSKTTSNISKDKRVAPPKAKSAAGDAPVRTKVKSATSKKSASTTSASKKPNPKPVGARKASSSKVTPKKSVIGSTKTTRTSGPRKSASGGQKSATTKSRTSAKGK